MAFITQLDTSTLTNQNISSALLCHTFTNTTRKRKIYISVDCDQVAGNGAYSVYATIQRAGTGSAFRAQPTTSATVASGVTAISFESIPLVVGATDVVKVYVTGLAGDTTTPDITTYVDEEFVLTDASGQVTVGAVAADAITAAAIAADAIGSSELAASAVTEIQSGLSTLTSVNVASAVLDATATSYNTTGTIGAKINTAAGAAGGGSSTYIATVTDANGATLDGVQVWATTDVAGANTVASGVTNSHGQVTFALDPGSYYLWRQRAGVNFSNPQGFTVT